MREQGEDEFRDLVQVNRSGDACARSIFNAMLLLDDICRSRQGLSVSTESSSEPLDERLSLMTQS